MFDHVSLEVADLARSAAFYDEVLARIGVRRLHSGAGAVAYGRVDARFWIVERGVGPAPAFGHVALEAVGRAAVDAAHAAGLVAGGRDAGAPGPRPRYGRSYYAGYLFDPDAYRVEVVSGGH